jgi:hypothetical protein
MSATVRWWLWSALGVALFIVGVSVAVLLGDLVLAFCVGSLFGIATTTFSYEMQGSRWYP